MNAQPLFLHRVRRDLIDAGTDAAAVQDDDFYLNDDDSDVLRGSSTAIGSDERKAVRIHASETIDAPSMMAEKEERRIVLPLLIPNKEIDDDGGEESEVEVTKTDSAPSTTPSGAEHQSERTMPMPTSTLEITTKGSLGKRCNTDVLHRILSEAIFLYSFCLG